MENIFGVVVFIIFVIVSLVAKINEGRKKTEEGRTFRKPSEEELPEAVRRMLYGNKEIPTARPAQPRAMQKQSEGPAHPIPVSIPRPPDPPINQQRAQQQATLQQQQHVQQRQVMPVQSRRATVSVQRMQSGQQQQRVVQQRVVVQRPQVPQVPPSVPLQPSVPAIRRAPVARRSTPVVFRDLRQLRSAIIYSEILGKPVSLRDER